MGCGASKDVKKPRRPITPPPSYESHVEAVQLLSYWASGWRQSGAVPVTPPPPSYESVFHQSMQNSLTTPPPNVAPPPSYGEAFQSLQNRLAAPQGNNVNTESFFSQSTATSRIHQDILLHMNQGAGENLRFSSWDFGGQDTFYGLHQLHMGRNSVYVLMFNMKWFLADSDFSPHLAFLAFWLNSIAAHAEDPDPKSHSVAPIILLSTLRLHVKWWPTLS